MHPLLRKPRKFCSQNNRGLRSKPRSSAVGSAPRSGRGGRVFESPLLDKKTVRRPPFLLRGLEAPVFLSHFVRTIIARTQFSSHLFSTKRRSDDRLFLYKYTNKFAYIEKNVYLCGRKGFGTTDDRKTDISTRQLNTNNLEMIGKLKPSRP